MSKRNRNRKQNAKTWADEYIAQLKEGKEVQFRPRGNSMQPLIENNQLVTVSPRFDRVNEGDIVLVTVKDEQFLHKVIKKLNHYYFTIGNNKGGINGTVHRLDIHGKVTNIQD